MLTFIVYLIGRIRRLLKRAPRGMRLIAECLADAQQLRRATERRYPFAVE